MDNILYNGAQQHVFILRLDNKENTRAFMGAVNVGEADPPFSLLANWKILDTYGV